MAENTPKYYWFKMTDDFFSDIRVLVLLENAGAQAVLLYQKMVLKSISNGGIIEYCGYKDNFYEELALKLREDKELCKITLETLEKVSLIETDDGKTYFFPQALEYTGSESSNAEAMRKSRANKKKNNENQNVTQCDNNVITCDNNVTQCYIEKEKEIEIEKEIDIDSKKDEEDAAGAAAHRLRLNNGEYFCVFNNDIEHWSKLYPNVNISQELRSMEGWLEANPEKRKAETEMLRFINSWLTRKQESAAMQPMQTASVNEKKPYTPDPTASYDIRAVQERMNRTVPKLKKKNPPR